MGFHTRFLLIAYILAIVILSSISAQDLGTIYTKTGITDDNIIHFLAFFILGFLLCRTFAEMRLRWGKVHAIAAGTMIAVIIELAQMALSTRHSQSFDLFLHFIAVLSYCAMEWAALEIWYRLSKDDQEKI